MPVSKPETFIATILVDGKVTIPIEIRKVKNMKKGKRFRIAVLEEMK